MYRRPAAGRILVTNCSSLDLKVLGAKDPSMASQHFSNQLSFARKLRSAVIAMAAVTAFAVFGQSSVPDWQTAAGGKMAFEVASVKRNQGADRPGSSNVPLGPADAFSPTGGLFSTTNYPLSVYVTFAYKLTVTQIGEMLDQLPKWNRINRYDIEARAAGNPSKDQYRLMMQSLLADRFKLAIHFETKQLPVLALVLDKPGKLGPKLRQHSTDEPCPTGASLESGIVPALAGGFPQPCGAFEQLPPSAPGRFTGGARNVPMPVIASTFSAGLFRTFKPVVDRTGLIGDYDFVIDFSPELPNVEADPNGPTFLEALKDQLGLKLESAMGAVDTIVIDHIEVPSEN
jgi:uncharacterized protein (TIGR03435 family)